MRNPLSRRVPFLPILRICVLYEYDESIVHSRDVFRAAVAMNAYAVVLMHSHPSGDAQPSEADTRLTKRMAEAGNILQITLLDHVIIVGDGKWFSFKEAGLI